MGLESVSLGDLDQISKEIDAGLKALEQACDL